MALVIVSAEDNLLLLLRADDVKTSTNPHLFADKVRIFHETSDIVSKRETLHDWSSHTFILLESWTILTLETIHLAAKADESYNLPSHSSFMSPTIFLLTLGIPYGFSSA